MTLSDGSYLELDPAEAGKLESLRTWPHLSLFPLRRVLADGRCDCETRPGSHGSRCAGAGKHPARRWSELKPAEKVPCGTSGYGVVTGSRSGGVVVLDLDEKDGRSGTKGLAELESQHGALPPTFTVQTPSGGWHLYFLTDQAAAIRSTSDVVADGVDVRAEGGMVVGPGSPHRNGGTYTVHTNLDLAALPDRWVDHLIAKTPKEAGRPRRPRSAPPNTHAAVCKTKPAATTEHEATAAPAGNLALTPSDLDRLRPSSPELREAVRQLRNGEIIGTRGSRHDVLTGLIGSIANAFPLHDSESVERCFAPSMAKIREFDEENGYPVYPDGFVAATFEDFRERDLSGGLSATAMNRMSARGGLNAPYRDEDIAAAAKFAGVDPRLVGSRIILIGPRHTYYFLTERGYAGPYDKPQLESQARRHLAPWPSSVVQLFWEDKDGKRRRKSMKQLLDEYGCPLDRIILDLRVDGSQLDSVDGEIVLRQAAGRRATIEPQWHQDVDDFFRALSGTDGGYYALFWWLVFLLQLAVALPALWLTGEAGIGKSMLLAALSKLFRRGRVVSGEKGTQRFNAALADCPLVGFEEHPPKDSRGLTDLDILKRKVTESSHEVEPKGKEVRLLEGYLRVVLTSNNLDMVKPDRDMTDQDIDAICERIIHIDCSGQERKEAVLSVLDRHPTDEWVGRLIPEHVAFMQQQYRDDPQAPPRTGRLRVPPYSAQIRLALQRESGRTEDLVMFFLAFLELHLHQGGATGATANVIVRGGQLLATQSSIAKHWDQLNPKTSVPGTKQIRSSWKRVVSKAPAVSVHTSAGSRKFRAINVDLLRDYAERNDGLPPAEIDRALAIDTKPGSGSSFGPNGQL